METKKKIKKPVSDTEMEREVRTARQRLDQEEKVRVYIPKDGGDKAVRIKINGTLTVIPKGKEVIVPYSVGLYVQNKYSAQMLSEAKAEKLAKQEM